MSPYAVRSTTVGKELDAAAELDKVIIPVLLQDAEPPERLKQIQWMDFRVSFRQGELRQLLELLKDNTSFVEDQDIHVPPRSYKWKGVDAVNVCCLAGFRQAVNLMVIY